MGAEECMTLAIGQIDAIREGDAVRPDQLCSRPPGDGAN
jgi:hypothetical protein